MLAGRAAAGTAAGISSAVAGTSSVSGEPRSGAGAALADDTGAGSDGVVVVVGADSVRTDSVAVGSDCQDTIAGSPPVFVITTVRCSGCGVGCGAASGSALGGTESDGGGGGSVSVGGASTTTTGGGGVVTTGGGGAVGAVGAGSATCCPPLTIVVVLSPLVVGGGCCSVEEGCSFAHAALELSTKATRHKTRATTRARGLRSCRWAWMAVLLCGCPRVKSLRTLPNVVPRQRCCPPLRVPAEVPLLFSVARGTHAPTPENN